MTPAQIELNADQVDAILTEGLKRGMYETPNNTLPNDASQKLEDAQRMVSLSMAAAKNGTKSENVHAILFLAQVDLKPPYVEPAVAAVAATGGSRTIPADATPAVITDFDITQVADGVLEGLIIGLNKFPNNEKVEAERAAYMAEKERRTNASSTAPAPQAQVAQTAQTGAETPAQSATEAPSNGNVADNQESVTVAQENGSAGQGTAISTEPDKPEEADASAFARVQTPEQSKEGKAPKGESAEENAERDNLEKQLNLSIIKAHGVDITKLGAVSVEQIKFMLANPEGPPKVDKMPVEVDPVPHDETSVGGITEVNAPDHVVTKADLGLDQAETEPVGNLTPEREQLESLVTGPMLKAYGRGRKEVPSIGDNELRFMILNATGQVAKEELLKARELDGDTHKTIAPQEETVIEPVNPAVVKQEQIAAAHEAPPDDRTIAQAAQEAVTKTPEVIVTPEQYAEAYDKSDAMAIIARENFPVPPEIDEKPPILPFDVSKSTREDLFSYHAQFHACESRINWVISGFEDELGDVVKLKSDREVTVAASIPLTGDDGKRITNEYRDSQVAADAEVRDFANKVHEATKVVNKLKVLQRNYHMDCERLSRQMSKYEREKNDLPR